MPGCKVDLTKVTEIAPGVFQKNDKTFYVRCTVNGGLFYCNKPRFDKLVAKHGSPAAVGATYVSREAQRVAKSAKNPDASVQ